MLFSQSLDFQTTELQSIRKHLVNGKLINKESKPNNVFNKIFEIIKKKVFVYYFVLCIIYVAASHGDMAVVTSDSALDKKHITQPS